MDYDDELFVSAPIRYALDRHDSDEEEEAFVISRKVTIKADMMMANTAENAWTLVFGMEGPGNVYINSLENENATVIGTVTRLVEGQEPTVKANIIQLSDKPILLIPFLGDILPEEARTYAKTILDTFNGKVNQVIVLDSFSGKSYIPKTTEVDNIVVPPFLRVLQTSCSPVLQDVHFYETPNLVKGLSAAVINYCEMHHIRCYDFLTLQASSIYGKTVINKPCLDAYDQGLKKTGLSFSVNESVMHKVIHAHQQSSCKISDSQTCLYSSS